jgi:hypothetical protein
MLTFLQKERLCEMEFMENGPFWHVCTDGTMMSDIFCTVGAEAPAERYVNIYHRLSEDEF